MKELSTPKSLAGKSMLRIDESKVFNEIRKKNAKRIVLNAPDGILSKVQELAERVENDLGVQAIIVAEPTYGSCDTIDEEAKKLNADIAFHIGHKVSFEMLGKVTIMVDAYDDVEFDEVVKKATPLLKKYKKVGLCTISQHLHMLSKVKNLLEEKGIKVLIGKGKGRLLDGQVLGCEFHTIYEIKEQVNVFVFLGQSPFHAIGVALSTGKQTFMLDPYMNEIVDASKLAEKSLKRAILSIYKALDCSRFGVVFSLKEGQFMLDKAIEIKNKLKKYGKSVVMLAMREITNDRLMVFNDVEAFIIVACPRIPINGFEFKKPVLSYLQAQALFDLIEKKEIGDFLNAVYWI
jgi:2-(3-amino-3-carboxypropyl)histidine synthase